MEKSQLKNIKKSKMIIENELKEIEKRKAKISSVPSVRNIRRPRLERGLGRGGLLRRQKQTSMLDTQKQNLLRRKKILDKLLEEKNEQRKVFQKK